VLLDETGGVGFRKGCYVGQEVVSRMQHRGTARRRVLIVSAERRLPAPGTELTVAGRPVGTLGTAAGTAGLAIARIDRV
ncbi:MAG: folate-binding protein, partial [Mesorhizobium sp.]